MHAHTHKSPSTWHSRRESTVNRPDPPFSRAKSVYGLARLLKVTITTSAADARFSYVRPHRAVAFCPARLMIVWTARDGVREVLSEAVPCRPYRHRSLSWRRTSDSFSKVSRFIFKIFVGQSRIVRLPRGSVFVKAATASAVAVVFNVCVNVRALNGGIPWNTQLH